MINRKQTATPTRSYSHEKKVSKSLKSCSVIYFTLLRLYFKSIVFLFYLYFYTINLLEVAEVRTPQWGSTEGVRLRVWRGPAAVRTVSGGSPRSRCQPVVRERRHVCVRGAPRGRSRHGTALLSAVIFHNAGQIRLELTAEDIQLDCPCHSVASIRAPPLCSPSRRGRTHRAPSFSVISIYVDLQLPRHYFCHWMFRFKPGACKCFGLHCSPLRCSNIVWPQHQARDDESKQSSPTWNVTDDKETGH